MAILWLQRSHTGITAVKHSAKGALEHSANCILLARKQTPQWRGVSTKVVSVSVSTLLTGDGTGILNQLCVVRGERKHSLH